MVGSGAPQRGSAAAAASMRRRKPSGSSSGGGASGGGAAGSMLQFYTDDAPEASRFGRYESNNEHISLLLSCWLAPMD
ncbi:hypothetical protein F2Q70_00008842 [Brassica cretica]|uniref:Uncharacterized protein n=1 Tax=Brassica cretica TaxID=69181 RepID=A0A8S9LVW6_BRACR|nr:hypothetical protein F2Q70_00008842 [Brassica cretica]